MASSLPRSRRSSRREHRLYGSGLLETFLGGEGGTFNLAVISQNAQEWGRVVHWKQVFPQTLHVRQEQNQYCSFLFLSICKTPGQEARRLWGVRNQCLFCGKYFKVSCEPKMFFSIFCGWSLFNIYLLRQINSFVFHIFETLAQVLARMEKKEPSSTDGEIVN